MSDKEVVSKTSSILHPFTNINIQADSMLPFGKVLSLLGTKHNDFEETKPLTKEAICSSPFGLYFHSDEFWSAPSQ